MGHVDASRGRPRPLRALTWPLRMLRRLAAVVPAAIDGYFVHRCPQHAAGIAYRVLFSLAPLAIVLVSVFGLVLQDDQLRADVVDAIVDRLPVSEEGGQDVEDAITRLASPASALGLLSLLVFVWGATGMMAALRTGLEAALAVERSRPPARGKLVDLVLVVGTGALVLLAVFLTLAFQLVEPAGGGAAGETVRRLAPVVVSTVVVMLLYRFVPARRLRFRAAFAGAVVTAALLLAISLLSALAYERFTDVSVVYGSLAAALVFLYSIYLYASALLFGAEVASAWSRPPSGPGEPIAVQLRRALVGLFVHRDEASDGPETGRADERRPRGRTT